MTPPGPENPDAPLPGGDGADDATAPGGPTRFPEEALGVLARALDAWARGTEDVQQAVGALPRFDKHGGGHAVGVYVDDVRGPWVELNGELRFSLLRLYSVTPRGVRLIGQIQVTATLKETAAAAPGETGPGGRALAGSARAEVRLHFYVHELEAPGTREVGSSEDLAREVLEKHAGLAEDAAPKDGFDPAFL